MKAKFISKIGMIIGALIIICYNAFYLITTEKIPTVEEQKSILLFGGSIVVIFSPVYLSIVLDKIGSMFGNNKNNNMEL
jgi:hypothetical protein